jgi:quercetin dioxygenase-like cupin family protein
MIPATFEQFKAAALAEGFDEVVERQWKPGTELPHHTHPFALRAQVVQGEMWLTAAGQTRHLRPGDSFALDAMQEHAERYGEAGATYWVARRHIAAAAR